MRPAPFVTLAAAVLLTVPMALGAGGLAGELASTSSQAVDTGLGIQVEHDGNHTNNVAIDPGSDDPAVVGRWLGPIDGDVPAVNLALLPGGKLLYYSGVEAGDWHEDIDDLMFMWQAWPIDAQSRVMDLDVADDGTVSVSVATPTPETGAGIDLFCSGTSVAPDGTIVATGGTEWHTLDEPFPDNALTPLKGSEQVMLFHGEDDTWTRGADMAQDRWYPSAIQIADGRTLIASGIQTLAQFQTHNTDIEIYDPVTDTHQHIEPTLALADGVEVGQLFESPGETGYPSIDETHDRIPNLPMYPQIFTVPSGPHKGDVFYTTAGDLWGPFGEHPLQALWSFMQTFDLDAGTWTVHDASVFGARQLGNAVPLLLEADDGYAARYLVTGGTLQQSFVATNTAEVLDLSGETPASAATDAMALPRWNPNSVLLPNGDVVTLGGGLYDNVVMHGAPEVAWLNGEIYDADTGQWQLTAPMTEPRVYHSSALLMPDGRVLVGGHVPLPAFHHLQRSTINPQVTDSTFELYEPPYLFLDSDRPVIEGMQVDADYGQAIQVLVTGLDAGADSLDSVVLVRPGASTHAFNADQRAVELTVLAAHTAANGVTELMVEAPSDGAVAPPGHYMLFVNEDVDGKAMPSEAGWVRIG